MEHIENEKKKEGWDDLASQHVRSWKSSRCRLAPWLVGYRHDFV